MEQNTLTPAEETTNVFTISDMTTAENVAKPKLKNQNVPYWTSCRLLLALMVFLGVVNAFILRTNINFGIICMVRQKNATEYRLTLNDTSSTLSGTTFVENATYNGSRIIAPTCGKLDVVSARTYKGEFDWDTNIRGVILSSVFYGYACTQIIGGWLAGRYGGKHVFGTAMVIAGVTSVVTPIAARTHYSILIALRVLTGMTAGVCLPALQAMWRKWAPPLEKSTLVSFCFSGGYAGIVVAMSLSGVLCGIDLDNGWPFIFYVYGGLCFIWLCGWYLLVFDSPASHPRISQAEREYIETAIGHLDQSEEKVPVPWASFVKSPAVWAIFIMNFTSDWGCYTLVTSLPIFMKEVLQFDIKQNGLFSAIPYVALCLGTGACGKAADHFRQRGLLNTTRTRKLFQSIGGFVPAAFMFATAFVDCETRMLGVVYLILGVTFSSASVSTLAINVADIAPRFAGEIFGISNTLASFSGIISPNIVAALTPNGTREEWKWVFFITCAIYSFGALFFLIFASGEVQPWGKPDHLHNEDKRENTDVNQGYDNAHPDVHSTL
ncbi:uncharacterized transporter slc-17.2-like [Lingula anatina]|uniref:Uncharacterized transporter slc-17.2-like n=1 Tax=Lingula anatina TaxID=7574 RepID=A0A1S3HBU4_LINAN|nr:uncharacterized transporter slc-17.2-like [Lingula anatina]|eukprot:XP_013382624.1 uncharacterized transporter slc-17.2-like [Lingula anatina]